MKVFVAFNWNGVDGKKGEGNADLTLTNKIVEYKTIREIEKKLIAEDDLYLDVIISNWRYYD